MRQAAFEAWVNSWLKRCRLFSPSPKNINDHTIHYPITFHEASYLQLSYTNIEENKNYLYFDFVSNPDYGLYVKWKIRIQ